MKIPAGKNPVELEEEGSIESEEEYSDYDTIKIISSKTLSSFVFASFEIICYM